MTIVENARKLARAEHVGAHLFDEARTPIFEHITEVAALVASGGGSQEMIAAAWLHDIVEDTPVTLTDIGERFGSAVREMVDGLTDPEPFAALPLERRKQAQADRIRGLGDDVKRIKLCDQLSNARRVLERPPTDWDEAQQWAYVAGARKIVDECRGLWPALEERFDAVYAAAAVKLAGGG